MKKIMLSLAMSMFCLFGMNLNAQNFSVSNGETEYDDAQRAAIYIKMEPATDDVKDAWKDYMKDRFDVKVSGLGFLTNKDVLKAEKVTIAEISNKEMDLNSKIVEGEYGTDMMVFGSLGYDIYLSPNGEYAEQYKAMESIVYDFLGKYLPNHYAGQIEKAQKVVTDFVDTRDDLNKDIAKNKEDIEKMKKEIEELTKENEQKAKELVDTKEKLVKAESTLKNRKERIEYIKATVSRNK